MQLLIFKALFTALKMNFSSSTEIKLKKNKRKLNFFVYLYKFFLEKKSFLKVQTHNC